jgi:hypothetical protein
MIVEAQVSIAAAVPTVWAAITDIEHAAQIIGGVDSIEVLQRPASGLVGLKWRETRMLFGKPASVDKWITEATGNAYYKTRAEDQGFVFITTMRIAASGDGSILTSTHDSMAQGLLAHLMAIPMRLFFKGAVKKHVLQDLHDIKAAVEGTESK